MILLDGKDMKYGNLRGEASLIIVAKKEILISYDKQLNVYCTLESF